MKEREGEWGNNELLQFPLCPLILFCIRHPWGKDKNINKSAAFFYTFFVFSVPMDLDVKIKAVILGACFLIVSKMLKGINKQS